MTTKHHLLALLAASTLATVTYGCGGAEPPEATGADHATASGGEAEASCGGGACGAVDAPDDNVDSQ
jgi:hypothetical protein